MIHARGLARTYKTRRGDVDAVRGVDLDVDAGEIVGFLGPNGAGKTTTLRMLTTLLRPTRGEATVAGADLRATPAPSAAASATSRQSGSTATPRRAPARRSSTTPCSTASSAPSPAARGHELFGQLELDGLWDRKAGLAVRRPAPPARHRARPDPHAAGSCSSTSRPPGSTRRRAPTCGPTSRGLRDTRGSTVFLTTHYLDEADALCDRILVIDTGQIVAQGSPEELKQRVTGDAIVLDRRRADGRRPDRGRGRAAVRLERTRRRRLGRRGAASPRAARQLAGLLRGPRRATASRSTASSCAARRSTTSSSP